MAARQGKEHGMTVDRPTTLPPRWAESLLRMMLAPKDRDSVSGDLLEEYRTSIVPSLGGGANRWYIRQAVGYVLRQTWMWGALVAVILVTRHLFDSLTPIHYTPHVVPFRGAVTSWTLIAAVSLGPAWQTWRSGHLRSGFVQVVATAMLGGVLTCAGTLACLAIWHDPATLLAIQNSGGIDEATWGMPVLLLPIGLTFGVPGAIAGRAAAACYRAFGPKTASNIA
jgi:hypothetical protein